MKRDSAILFLSPRRSPLAVLAWFCLLLVIVSVCFLSACTSETKDDATGPDTHGILWTRYEGEFPGAGLTSLTRAELSPVPDMSFLDVLIYDDDSLRRLDTWQHFEPDDFDVDYTLLSGGGAKIFVFIANYAPLPSVSVSQMGSFDALSTFEIRLADDSSQQPVMTSVVRAESGSDLNTVTLEPLLSEVMLGTISYDFSGKEYENESLKNVCAYLINVSASTQILRDSLFTPSEVLNYGGLIESDMASLASPDMLYRDIPPFSADSSYEAGVKFCCYPNDLSEESMGQPFTRLVVQGDIAGQTCYYPIDVNRPGFGYRSGRAGLGRNVRYRVNLSLTQKGSDSPEGSIPAEDITESWMVLYPGQYIRRPVGDYLRVWVEVYPEDTPVQFDIQDLEDDTAEGYYTYELEDDGRAVVLHLLRPGMGMFCVDAGPPVNNGFLILVIID
jgi:hypothetical protein